MRFERGPWRYAVSNDERPRPSPSQLALLVAAWSAEAGDTTQPDRIIAGCENIGIV